MEEELLLGDFDSYPHSFFPGIYVEFQEHRMHFPGWQPAHCPLGVLALLLLLLDFGIRGALLTHLP